MHNDQDTGHGIWNLEIFSVLLFVSDSKKVIYPFGLVPSLGKKGTAVHSISKASEILWLGWNIVYKSVPLSWMQ